MYSPATGLHSIDYSAGEESMGLKSYDVATDSFYEKLLELREQACAIMGINSTLAKSRLTPVGVSYSRDKDGSEMYRITCVWKIVAGEYVRIKLPRRQAPVNPLSEQDKKLLDALEDIKVEAECYVKGERAERDLFENKAEGTVNDKEAGGDGKDGRQEKTGLHTGQGLL